MLPFPSGLIDGRYDFDLQVAQYKTLSIYRRLLFLYSNLLSHLESDKTSLFKTLNINVGKEGRLTINNVVFDYEYDEDAIRFFIREVVSSTLDRDKDLNPVFVNVDKILKDEKSDYMSINCTSLDDRTTCMIEFSGNVAKLYNDLCAYLGPEYMGLVPIYSTNREEQQFVDPDFKRYFEKVVVPQKRGEDLAKIYDSMELKKA